MGWVGVGGGGGGGGSDGSENGISLFNTDTKMLTDHEGRLVKGDPIRRRKPSGKS